MKSLVGLVVVGCAANAPVVHPPAQRDAGTALGTALGHAGFSCQADDDLQAAMCIGVDGWPVYIAFDHDTWTLESYEHRVSGASCTGFDIGPLDSARDGFSVRCSDHSEEFSFETSFVVQPDTDYAQWLRNHLEHRASSVAQLERVHAIVVAAR